MAKQPGVWGIDLGQCALKAIRLENVGGTITATAFEHIEHPKILSQPDADPDELIREALQKFLSRNNIRGDQLAISVPGQQGLARFVKLPPVEEKKISEIVKFEAKQQIPFPLDEVVWDYQKIGAGLVADGFAMETEIGLFAIKRETVMRVLEPYQSLDVDVHCVQLAPLALCNFIAYDLLKKDGLADGSGNEGSTGKKKCVVALDIGVDNSNLVITDGERVVWQRAIPIGGNRFTRALTKELKLTYAKAEHLKRNASKSPQLKNILMAMRTDLAEFANEVQKSIAFFQTGQKDAQIQYVVGLGNAFKLPGLQKYLMEKLQVEVKRLPKFLRLTGDAVVAAPVFNDNIMSMGTAYGLALQGLKLSRLQTNLLPQDIRMERLVKAKKPWAVSAAACLLLGTGILAFGYKMQHDAFASPAIEAAIDRSKTGALGLVAQWNAKIDQRNKLNADLERAVGSIVAGQKERVNWLELNRFINEALPSPADARGLSDELKTAYWEKGGKTALARLGLSAVRPESPGGNALSDLVQVNIEATNALWSDDLGPYFERLKEQCRRDDRIVLTGMADQDQKNAPTGPGWVVELRGYVTHHDQALFVANTLVANLNAQAKARAAKKDGPPEFSHVVLYRATAFPANPQDLNKFELINTSDLKYLVTGLKPDQKRVDPPPTLTSKGAAPVPAIAQVDAARLGWTQAGNVAGVAKARAALKDDKEKERPKDRKDQLTRTEFVVLFIWREPLVDELPAVGDIPSGLPAAKR